MVCCSIGYECIDSTDGSDFEATARSLLHARPAVNSNEGTHAGAYGFKITHGYGWIADRRAAGGFSGSSRENLSEVAQAWA